MGLKGGYRGGETGETDDAVEDNAGGSLGEPGSGAGACNLLGMQIFEVIYVAGLEGHVSRIEFPSLLLECPGVTSGREAYYFEAFRMRADNVEGLETNAARRA